MTYCASTTGNDVWDDNWDNDRHHFEGGSSIPKMKQNRKRSAATAGFRLPEPDDFAEEFERRLKLTPHSTERLKVADELLKSSQLRNVLMKELPEHCVRKMAATCSEWRTVAYKAIRERWGNNAFSLLWISDDQSGGYDTEKNESDFDLNMYLHHAYLGSIPASGGGGLLEVGKCQNNCAIKPVEPVEAKPPSKVGFILTYASINMESEFLRMEQDENQNLKSATRGACSIMVLSPSVIATTPDARRIVHSDTESLGNERKLVTSTMFPQSAHVLLECFLVPASLCEAQLCISSVIGDVGLLNKQTKVLILYQYLNLQDSNPGIVEVLNSLKLTQGSRGFPMITGIYNYLDGCVKNESDKSVDNPVASGLLVCGDDFCNASVLSLNLMNVGTAALEIEFQKMFDFYNKNNFSTKYALLFYHNEVASGSGEGCVGFKCFVDSFQRRLPGVGLLGIGSLSGAHAMFVNPEANTAFNQLNIRMMGLTGTVEAKTSAASMELILVLLSYEA